MNLKERIFLQTIGLRVRQCREAQGWTQAQLGERCGLHRTFIGSVERGERNVSILNLRAIALVLRMSLPELLADERGTEGA
jgi:transcriptional regulator with XRE-family HTH domain